MHARLLVALLSAMIPLLGMFAPAVGSDAKWQANANRGKRFAERICAGCHLIGTGTTQAAVAGVPSFKAIANSPGRTEASLKSALIKPHPPMPDMQLTMHEIGDLLAYIDTLRKGSAPKSNDDNEHSKPVYPSPS